MIAPVGSGLVLERLQDERRLQRARRLRARQTAPGGPPATPRLDGRLEPAVELVGIEAGRRRALELLRAHELERQPQPLAGAQLDLPGEVVAALELERLVAEDDEAV